MASSFPEHFFTGNSLWKPLLPFVLFYIILIPHFNNRNPQFLIKSLPLIPQDHHNVTRTNLSHIFFGLTASVKTLRLRRPYLESWWRPNQTRGYVYLDRSPPPEPLPWPETAPPYRVADTDLRMVHAVLQDLFLQEHGGIRWVVIGNDDSVFFVENIVEVLAEYDHTKFYFFSGPSESMVPNYRGGSGGFVLSYPVAAALARDMEGCLLRHGRRSSPDFITAACIADIGVAVTPHKGIHQVDLRGDFSGYLSAHPKVPVLAFRHLASVDPIFPAMDRAQSTRHLMKAAEADQSRLLQQTICHHRQTEWSISVSWGYSVQIYESISCRSHLQTPVETFRPGASKPDTPPYTFNTRPVSMEPCEAPHVFFFESLYKSVSGDRFVTSYVRARPRGLPPCSAGGNRSADPVVRVEVYSPLQKRSQVDRCECCDVAAVDGAKVEINYRECGID